MADEPLVETDWSGRGAVLSKDQAIRLSRLTLQRLIDRPAMRAEERRDHYNNLLGWLNAIDADDSGKQTPPHRADDGMSDAECDEWDRIVDDVLADADDSDCD